MKPFEVNVSSKYGAPMGRHTEVINGKAHLQKVPFYDGCYDKGGAYWGGPADLWCAWNETGTRYVRAPNRDAAKQAIIKANPEVRFYR
jgi:hypothetical protein